MKLSNLKEAEDLVSLAVVALANEIPADKISEDKVRRAVLALFDNPDLFHTLRYKAGELVAFFVGQVHEGLFDERLYAVEISAYVKPAFRNMVLAKEMLEEFELWAQEKGAHEINLITFASLAKPLRARGYDGNQIMFHKEL